MNVLLIYPKFPDTFWSFTYALSFIGKKAAFPPLGLLTVATLLPDEWPKRLVDVNVESLTSFNFAETTITGIFLLKSFLFIASTNCMPSIKGIS